MDHSHTIAKTLAENASGDHTGETIVDLMSVDATVVGGTFRVYVPQWADAGAGQAVEPQIYEITVRRMA